MSIKVGDLVMVVKPAPCCGCPGGIGDIFIAEKVEKDFCICPECGKKIETIFALDAAHGEWAEIERLIKIDPPALPESQEREKELSV